MTVCHSYTELTELILQRIYIFCILRNTEYMTYTDINANLKVIVVTKSAIDIAIVSLINFLEVCF